MTHGRIVKLKDSGVKFIIVSYLNTLCATIELVQKSKEFI